MAQVTGIVYLKIDGALQRSKEGAKLSLGGKERTPQVGHSVYGYSEKVVPATLEFTLAHVGGDDLIGLSNKIESTLEFETDTGDIYMVRNAFCTKPAEITGGEGDVSFEFAGDPAELSS
jgi:hypothetical protein